MVFADSLVYYLNDIDGKKWCVTFEPHLSGEAIFVTNSRKLIVGINDSCTYQGLNLHILNRPVNE